MFLTELTVWRTDSPRLRDTPGNTVLRHRRGYAPATPARCDRITLGVAASPWGRHLLAQLSAQYMPITDANLVAEETRQLVTCSSSPNRSRRERS